MSSKMLSAQLRCALREEEILEGVSVSLHVAHDLIKTLEEASPATPVVVEIYGRARGFRTSVTVYVKVPEVEAPSDDIEFAKRLAKHVGEDALARRPNNSVYDNPYIWILVTPTGETRLVSEVPSDDDELIIKE